MRNLVIQSHHVYPEISSSIQTIAFDTINDSLYIACGLNDNNPGITLYRIYENNVVEYVAEHDDPSYLKEDGSWDQICNMQFLGDSMSICISMKGGDIIMVKTEPAPGEPVVEVIGNVENGIVASCWSPDEQVLSLLTGGNTILLMTKRFDVIAETELSENDLVEFNKHISVGWGRSETQFRGKRVRAKLRDPTLPEHIDEGKLSEVDDGKVIMCWRGDGAYVAINRIEAGPRRAIRVYSREGVLDSISEPQDGHQSFLSWKPSGSVLASIQSFEDENKSRVIFFERNGLRHGEFSLECAKNEKFTGLAWNNACSILAISTPHSIALWSTGNYHWYLKKTIPISSNASFCWHPERTQSLFVISNSHVERVDLEFTFPTCKSAAPNDYGLTSVIDGSSLLITPLYFANIPPPLSLCALSLPFKIQLVSTDPSSTLIYVSDNLKVHVYKYEPKRKPTLLDAYDVSEYTNKLNVKRLLGLDKSKFIILADDKKNNTKVFLFQCPETKHVSNAATLLNLMDVGKNFVNISYIETLSKLFLQSDSGEIFSLNTNDYDFEKFHVSFPKTCAWFTTVLVDDSILPIGLTSSGRLYAEQRLLSTGVLSFYCTDRFLAFTTNKHVLKFVHLQPFVDDMKVVEDEGVERHDERCRSVERGSKIVTMMPTKMAVVLQMPRGNLETIFPRIMVLNGVRKLIDISDYSSAFKVCRTHRLDLNMLFDYDPEKFFSNVSLFVDQLGRVDYLDLFFASLKPEDVTQSMYMDTSKYQLSENIISYENKVNTICKSVRDILISKNDDRFFQSIITSYLCELPPSITEALNMISRLIESKSSSVDSAIEHMCFLVDVNMLFDHALGLYDLKLALLIAQQSQKDPREYVPFLQNFQKQDVLRRKFNIDCYLKRYERGLSHLKEIEGAFEELKDYVIKHQLYRRALELYKYDKEKQKSILIIYAHYLRENGKANEAAIAFESVNMINEAIEAYKSAGMWRECMSILQFSSASDSKVEEIANDLANLCLEKRDYVDAANIYLIYLSNMKEAIVNMCKGTQYSEAIRLARATEAESSLYKDVLLPAIGESFGEASEMVADFTSQIKAQTERIIVLRAKKKEDPTGWEEGNLEDQTPDDLSLASTSVSTNKSLYTRYTKSTASTKMTRNTAKNNRRLEKKRARGKKGTVFEEEYLVNSLKRLISRVESMRAETYRLLEALMRCDMYTQASELQRGFSNVITTLREKVVPILSVPVNTFETAVGEQAVAPEIPEIKPFEKLGILI
ncbi:elongator subunit Iki3 [Schizosaccharomyces cryophilus OY26]|uniref:Elongator complex protein 1 n=1 Tax=Schizosaccharomyces cryophilus (strain OY26 / ATCC MYA-4695 / CBS 11777 / NBRC 106824 / NRRL Y48691) TaxID=653667 RepID=S9W8P7_SCHCR|nr:elongator subunit Iki3 [Schizosaccharomyces cryophilus OY26]EPY54265.1 elongator subunit Iki3 [Schizosaccharomyces cryophilus OY26]